MQRVAGVQQRGVGQARLVQRADGLFGEADPLVALEHGGQLAAVAAGDQAVALADGGRHVGDLEAAGLARIDRAAQRRKGLHEEGAHEIGLQAARLGLLHLLFHGKEPFGAHRLLRQGVAVQDRQQFVAIEGVFDALAQPGAHLGLVAVADGLRAAGP